MVVASRNDRGSFGIVKGWTIAARVFVEAAFLELSVKEGSDVGASMHSGVTAEGTDWVDAEESPWVAGALAGGAGIVGSTTAQGLRSISPVSAAGLLGLVGAFQGVSIPGLDEAFGVKIPTFGVVFQALKSTTGVDVLSTPHLLTTDNEEAEITVGKNVPFASSMMGGLGNLASLASAAGGSSTASAGLGALGGLGLPSVSIQRRRRPQAADAPRDQHRSGPDGASRLNQWRDRADDQLAHHDERSRRSSSPETARPS